MNELRWRPISELTNEIRYEEPDLIMFHQDGYSLGVWPVEMTRGKPRPTRKTKPSGYWIGRNGMQYPEKEFTHFLILVPPTPETPSGD